MKQLLVIGQTFPEPSTTAAGSRMMQLIELFKEGGYAITFASAAIRSEKAEKLESHNVSIKNIALNDSAFDVFIKTLNPSTVLFDRYITEEQFGWRVAENCPNALKILDTEDLHFLRKARQEAIKNGRSIAETNLFTNTAKRELASILRCDVSLLISECEMNLLQDIFKIPSEILYYLPFLVEKISKEAIFPSFGERKNFIAIGNLLHEPNVDSVFRLKTIWPKIKKQLPEAELHVYGAYAPQKILQLNNKKEGFIIKGWAEDVETAMKSYCVQLAPIRFGAGLKGKLFDAMRFGLPSVTTKVGAEGLNGPLPFAGALSETDEDFVKAAVKLYTEERLWNNAQQNGLDILQKRFRKRLFSENFKKHIATLTENLKTHRQQNFIGQILQHHTLQSTKYMSKWIEGKNSWAKNASPVCYQNSDELRDEYK